MKDTYFITKSKERNSLWIFTGADFRCFGEQLPTAMLKMYFMEAATFVEVDITNISDIIQAVREIPRLWDYLTDRKVEEIQLFQLEQEQVEGRGYNPWVLQYISEK